MIFRTLEDLYEHAKNYESDINEHVEWMRELASQCESVVELGVRGGVSTIAFLSAQPKSLTSYDINKCEVEAFISLKGKTDFKFIQGDSRKITIPICDMLFIDTDHSYSVLKTELFRHCGCVKKWILMHDTVLFAEKGMTEEKGLWPAINEFLKDHPEWVIKQERLNNNGMTLLERK